MDLFFTEAGSGTPMMLVHGFPLDHTIWDQVVPGLRNRARVITPDLRGYGQSPSSSGIYRMEDMAEDLVRLMDRLKIDRVILAGHSMGGYISLSFAAAFPDRLSGFALVTSQAAADAPERRQGRIAQAEKIEQTGKNEIDEAGLARYSPDPAVRAKTRIYMEKANPLAVAGCLRGMADRKDRMALLPSIRVPSVVIAGEIDDLISPRRSEEMVSLLPDARLYMVPGGGHMVMMEAPGAVVSALSDLLTRVEAI
ncbi:MAG: alpha/beta hydrolase [Anaerolineae bacterium]|nr:alpha/beta hydrolase [Anaerolineae bacterium]